MQYGLIEVDGRGHVLRGDLLPVVPSLHRAAAGGALRRRTQRSADGSEDPGLEQQPGAPMPKKPGKILSSFRLRSAGNGSISKAFGSKNGLEAFEIHAFRSLHPAVATIAAASGLRI